MRVFVNFSLNYLLSRCIFINIIVLSATFVNLLHAQWAFDDEKHPREAPQPAQAGILDPQQRVAIAMGWGLTPST
jgi:hypothetical protein